uniref:Uncharacterized protein n=1 Tax=Pseudomonas syringae group genomosp. 3 TaxID=251701 RepID=A0A330JXW5_9PSED|nr:hypothetical protein PSCFBP3800_P200052 [Pseudomonas syringae group genomosp. 3]
MRATTTLASATKIDVAKPHNAMPKLSSKPLTFIDPSHFPRINDGYTDRLIGCSVA